MQAIAGRKGGVGKTSLTVALASYCSNHGLKTLILLPLPAQLTVLFSLVWLALKYCRYGDRKRVINRPRNSLFPFSFPLRELGSNFIEAVKPRPPSRSDNHPEAIVRIHQLRRCAKTA